MDTTNRYRTIWLSDFHLGTRDCKAELLLDFIRHNEAEHLYLVGDVVDGWALRRNWHWPQLHNDVIQKLLRLVRKGTNVTYIPGNHDEFARRFFHVKFGGISILPHAVHTTVDGRQLLVVHGDEFDGVIKFAPWLSKLGAGVYQVLLHANRWVNRLRRWAGKPYWSLSAYLKHRTKKAVQYVGRFEEAVVEKARAMEVDGVVCGHIHHAELREIDGLLYGNSGDWVESCTALVEHLDGRLEIIEWMSMDHPPRRKVWSEGDGHIAEPELVVAAAERAR